MATNDTVQLNPPTIEQIEARSTVGATDQTGPAQKLYTSAYADTSAPTPRRPQDATAQPANGTLDIPPIDLFKSQRSEIPNAAIDPKESEAFKHLATKLIEQQNRTAPVAKGEGYYQVLQRMHKDWTPEHLYDEAHRIKNYNHNSNELRVGQRLSTISDWQKDHAVKERMAAFEKATPEQRKQMLAEVQKQIVPDKPVVHRHPQPHQQPHQSQRYHGSPRR
ncbi:MAG: hypothetical protein JSS86_13465 [Cyanobacteria bacterium SZAS LIN-2]|nr:hypothetical protein [Cyanobacteria bacterium SZAS LIN-2]